MMLSRWITVNLHFASVGQRYDRPGQSRVRYRCIYSGTEVIASIIERMNRTIAPNEVPVLVDNVAVLVLERSTIMYQTIVWNRRGYLYHLDEI